MNPVLLRLHDVCFDVGSERLLGPLGLELHSGRRRVLLGPNGAGKSLLLRLCHGLLAPSSGRVAWQGSEDEAGRRREQAMVFQHAVPMRRRVLGDLEFALSCRGVARSTRRTQAMAALAEFGLERLAQRPARVLSGGERQRLALARAWVLRPRLLFLDEPTAALDPRATREVEEAIGRFHAAGTAIFMSTHDLGQARRLADDVLFLHAGRITEQTPAVEFFEAPRSAEARAFLRGDLLC